MTETITIEATVVATEVIEAETMIITIKTETLVAASATTKIEITGAVVVQLAIVEEVSLTTMVTGEDPEVATEATTTEVVDTNRIITLQTSNCSMTKTPVSL